MGRKNSRRGANLLPPWPDSSIRACEHQYHKFYTPWKIQLVLFCPLFSGFDSLQKLMVILLPFILIPSSFHSHPFFSFFLSFSTVHFFLHSDLSFPSFSHRKKIMHGHSPCKSQFSIACIYLCKPKYVVSITNGITDRQDRNLVSLISTLGSVELQF